MRRFTPGVYVPPPRERAAPLDERIARVRQRGNRTPKVRPKPKPVPGLTELLAARADRENAFWERRRNQHLGYLASTACYGPGDAFFRIRYYIADVPYVCVGEWIPEFTAPNGVVDEGYWKWDEQRSEEDRQLEIAKVRQHIVEVFREVLGQAVCPHGQPWEDWTRGDKGCVGCSFCFVEYKLVAKGMKANQVEDILSWKDARPQIGNTVGTNTILGALGLGMGEGLLSIAITASNQKLESLQAAVDRDEKARRVTAGGKQINKETGEITSGGNGPDVSESKTEDT